MAQTAPANGPSPARKHGPRAVALVGPQGAGKTALFEALLAAAGHAMRRGADPRDRAMGTETRLAHCTMDGDPFALLDCPGSVEFAHEAEAALAIADLAIVVCEPAPARAVALGPIFRLIEANGLPSLVFINKLDTLGDARVRDTLEAMQAQSRRPLVLRQVPIREGEAIIGYVDLVSERAYRYRRGDASEIIRMPETVAAREREARMQLAETLADHDDALLEKFLEDAIATPQDLYRAMHNDLAHGAVDAVLLGTAERGGGVRRLWKALRHDTPELVETAARRGVDATGESPLAQVFKTLHTGHGGKLSYARLWRGALRDGVMLGGVRLGGISKFPGGEAEKVAEASEGEVVALGRLEGIATGRTIGAEKEVAQLAFPRPPAPVHALAIATDDRKDDMRLNTALAKLQEEDPALGVLHDAQLGQLVISGQGEIHLQTAIARLARAHGVKVTAARPRTGYRETIRRTVRQHARLKRQTGGHGQFADVTLEIEPRGRGEGFSFASHIVGGAVPKRFIPAVEEAAEDALKKGPLGQIVVDVAVRLMDGTFHSVDSSDMAFATATRMAMQEGLAKASPVLLEPIHEVAVLVPNGFTAAAQRLLSERRGQILGYAEREGWPGWDEMKALVPEAEIFGMITELRSMTMGLGTYTHRFDHLAEAQGVVAQKAAAGS
jgi:elongation factor G